MLYLLYGTQEYLINEKIKEIIENNKIEKYNRETFDLEEHKISDIIDAANTISLFSGKRLIIIENSFIFTGVGKKTEDKELVSLTNYLDHSNPDTILIFKLPYEKLDARKKIVTNFKKKATVLEFNKVENYHNSIKKMFEPYRIQYREIDYLLTRVGKQLDVLSQEIEKIKTYKHEDKEITKEDIELLTTKNINTDIFQLIDNIILNKKEDALESYYQMIKLGEEPIKIIVMLANQFRLIYQVKELYKKGYREYDIMDILEQKQYPIKKASEKMHRYAEEKLITCIYELANLDIQIKSGLIDKNIGLELFILNI